MKTLRLAAVLLLSATAVHAQAVRKVSFRVLRLDPQPGLAELWLPPADPKGKAVAVTVLGGSPSPVVEGSFKDNEAVFLSKPGEPASEVARGALAKSKRQLFLLLPAKDKEGAFEIRAFDDDTAVFKLGTVRAINLAANAARFSMGGNLLPEVAPGGSAIFPPPKGTDEFGMYPVMAEVRKEGDTWAKVYSASWKSSDRRREIAVVQYDERFKQWTVKLITDDPPWLQAE